MMAYILHKLRIEILRLMRGGEYPIYKALNRSSEYYNIFLYLSQLT